MSHAARVTGRFSRLVIASSYIGHFGEGLHPGVLNFHFGIGVRPEGPQMGA